MRKPRRLEPAMLDDIRNHDPQPTPEESAWMETDLPAVLGRVVTAAAVALVLTVGVSALFDVGPGTSPQAHAGTP